MGLFDFVKDAGAKLFGDDEKKAAPARGAESGGGTADDQNAEKALRRQIGRTGIEVDDLQVRYRDGKCWVSGKVASQADREKVILVCGNVAAVAQVEDSLEVESPEPEATFYTVVRGDTLSKIAKAHYGDATEYPVIFEANRPMLENPDRIYPGQVLRIPPS